MNPDRNTATRWSVLTAAPHRLAFLCGFTSLLLASAWWACHLLARYGLAPAAALDIELAPIWAHSFLMLFTVFPTFFLGFLYTTYPRWMNGPLVSRRAYVATPLLLAGATFAWLVGVHCGLAWQLSAVALALAGLVVALVALLRVLIDAPQVVSHAIVTSAAFAIGVVSLAGFGYGLWSANDFALHFAVRAALWGFLLPVFFAVCHRMVPFFSQNVVPGYVAWRPTWVLVAVVGLAWLRLLLGTAGVLDALAVVDAALFVLTAACAARWTSFARARQPAALDTVRGLRLAAGRDAAADDPRRELHAERRMGARPRTDPRARHRLLRRHAGGDGHARHDGPFGARAEDGPRDARLLLRHSGCRRNTRRQRDRDGTRRDAVAAARQRGDVARRPSGSGPRRNGPIYLAPRSDGKAGMTEYYLLLRHAHIGCAILTIALFVLRGGLMLADSPWQRIVVLRYLPHVIDTVLLTTALMLTTVIHQYPFSTGWVTMKVVLLVVYIVLGSIALKRGRTKRIRTAALVAALLTIGFLVTVARTHHPLGVFAGG